MSAWISVEEMLPPVGKDVLLLIVVSRFHGGTYVETEEVCTGGRDTDEDWWVGNKCMAWDYFYNLDLFFDDLTHWQPLPEPPK